MTPTPFRILDGPHGDLCGDIYLPPEPRAVPVIVACHGFKGFKDWGFWPEVGKRFAESKLALVTFNFSGSGIGEDFQNFTEPERFEANTIGKELDDLGRVLEAVAHREIPVGSVDVRRLGLLGHSRGGGVAIVRAGRDPRVRSLATWAGVATFQRFDDAARQLWHEQGYVEIENARTRQVFKLGVGFLEDLDAHAEAYDPVLAARRLRIPYLIVHGTRDESVPVEEAARLAHASDPGLTRQALIEGANHTFGATHPFSGSPPALHRAIERTISWFQSSLGAV